MPVTNYSGTVQVYMQLILFTTVSYKAVSLLCALWLIYRTSRPTESSMLRTRYNTTTTTTTTSAVCEKPDRGEKGRKGTNWCCKIFFGVPAWRVCVSVRYNGGLLPDIMYGRTYSKSMDTVDPMLLPSGNPFKCHEEAFCLCSL